MIGRYSLSLAAALAAASCISGKPLTSIPFWEPAEDPLFGGPLVNGTKIPLKINVSVVDMWGWDGQQDPAWHLTDEQALSGDPKYKPGSAGKPKTPWDIGGDDSWYPISNPNVPGPKVAIDLGMVYELTDIYLYAPESSTSYKITWTLSVENPYAPSATFETTPAPKAGWWRVPSPAHTYKMKAQIVTIAINAPPGTTINELVMYGVPPSEETHAMIMEERSQRNKVANAPPAEPKPMKYLLGTNGFSWSPLDLMDGAVGAVREYQAWGWSEGGGSYPGKYPGYPHNQCQFECLAQGGACYDDVLTNASNDKLIWHHDMLNVPAWFHDYNTSEKNFKQLSYEQLHTPNASITPSSYIITADHLWQVAARYGRKKVPESELKLYPYKYDWTKKTPQPKVSGLGLLDWMEVLNEPDKWWKTRNTYFSSEEQIAIQSASFDGHEGSMPKTVGIKQADPTMKVSYGATCTMWMENRFQTGLWWSQANRNDKMFPANAVNYHIYANDAYGHKEGYKTGVCPEQYGMRRQIRTVQKWRDTNAPYLEIWFTEFGYDTNPGSPQHAYPVGPWDAEEVQGMWNIRTVLAAAASGVNRAHFFMFADVTSGSRGLYGTSGVITSKPYKVKKGYFWYTCFLAMMADYTFVSEECGDGQAVCTQKWSTGSKTGYIVWSPTANNTKMSGYKVNVGSAFGTTGFTASAEAGMKTCNQGSLSVSGGMATVMVTENPLMILPGVPPTPVAPQPQPVAPVPVPTPEPVAPTTPTSPQAPPVAPEPAPVPPPSTPSCAQGAGYYCIGGSNYVECTSTSSSPRYRTCPQKENCKQDGHLVECEGAPLIDPCKNQHVPGKYCKEAFYPGGYANCPGDTDGQCPLGTDCHQASPGKIECN